MVFISELPKIKSVDFLTSSVFTSLANLTVYVLPPTKSIPSSKPVVKSENIPDAIRTPEIIYVNFLRFKKSIFRFLNNPFVRGVEKLSREPLFTSQLINSLEIKIAVNKEVIIPINNVVANPLIGPVPNVYKIKADKPVVIFATKIEDKAL